jgi:hypothetical protein
MGRKGLPARRLPPFQEKSEIDGGNVIAIGDEIRQLRASERDGRKGALPE